MNGLTIGLHCAAATADRVLDRITQAEGAGVDVAWMTSGGVAPDPLAVFSAAALRTNAIEFGTCIIPTFPRHPLALAQGAMVVEQLAPGRLRLGIGPSHEPTIRGMYSLPFERPLQHLREYVTILKALFSTGKVSFHGERLHAEASIAAPTNTPVMISALRPSAYRLAGRHADGGISWVCPIPYLRDVAVPAMVEGAAKAGRAKPKMVAHLPVVVSSDTAAVREAAKKQMGFYPRFPYYSQMFQDAGFPEAKEGSFTDAIADAITVHGSEEQVAARIRALPAAGIDEVIAMVITPAEDRGAYDRTVALLGSLARGTGAGR